MLFNNCIFVQDFSSTVSAAQFKLFLNFNIMLSHKPGAKPPEASEFVIYVNCELIYFY